MTLDYIIENLRLVTKKNTDLLKEILEVITTDHEITKIQSQRITQQSDRIEHLYQEMKELKKQQQGEN